MFLSSNKLSELRIYFLEQLEGIYPEREINNIFFLINDVKYGRSKFESSGDSIRISESEILFWNTALKRLKKNEPVQYILGKTDFHNVEIFVSSATLIPRPETEELVELILNTVEVNNAKCIDLGTGSACIPIALKKARDSWSIKGIDISEDALRFARNSAILNKVEVDFQCEDIFELNLEEKYDVIVSNPPYIPISEKDKMRKNVYEFEPDIALFVPENDPLLFYEAIVGLAIATLKETGYLFFEIHEDLSNHVVALLKENDFSRVEVRQDLQGKNRMVLARR